MNDHPASIGRFRIDRLLGEGGMGIVYLTSAGAKLLDVGLARALTTADATTTQTGAGLLAGTPAYMAPEQTASAISRAIRGSIRSGPSRRLPKS